MGTDGSAVPAITRVSLGRSGIPGSWAWEMLIQSAQGRATDCFLVLQAVTLHVQFGGAGLGEQKSITADYDIFRVTISSNPATSLKVGFLKIPHSERIRARVA